MIDVVSAPDGQDLVLMNSDVPRATNLLSVQLGSLEYAQALGIDLDYFLSEDVAFENESFKSYLIQTLADRGISVASLTDVVETLYRRYLFELSPAQQSDGLIAR